MPAIEAQLDVRVIDLHLPRMTEGGRDTSVRCSAQIHHVDEKPNGETPPQLDIRVTARNGFAAQKRGSGGSKAAELSRPSGADLLDSFVCDVQPKYGVLCCNG